MELFKNYLEVFTGHLNGYITVRKPENLYKPIQYILNIGGKRLRPILTLMSCDVFGKPCHEALDAALAVELFHNFSLMHDDIMDNAPLRRGHVTVHEKWDVNTAILSGDALLILAYQLFEKYPLTIFKQLAELFSKTAITVCEGQQRDMDFQSLEDVSVEQYLQMIHDKTAVLLGAALEMGAIVAGSSEADRKLIYDFGCNMGVAFQLQDDLLDVFGEPDSFGKQSGGDIIENKKTFLFLKALDNASEDNRLTLKRLYNTYPENPSDKIAKVRRIFSITQADIHIKKEIDKYLRFAFSNMEKVNIPSFKKVQLQQFAEFMALRKV